MAAPFGWGGIVVVHPSVYYGWSVCSGLGFSGVFVCCLNAFTRDEASHASAMLPSRPSFLPQPGPINRVDETRQTCGRHIILVGIEGA